MHKNKYLPWVVAAGFAVSLALVLPAFAQTQTSTPNGRGGHFGMRGGMAPGIFGSVTAVNGTTLTVTSKMRPNATSTPATAYAVDANNAQVFKNGATSTVSSIATGDTVMVQGTVNGTNVTATVIRDGMIGKFGMPGRMGNGFGHGATSTPKIAPIQGNGEPIVAGGVTAISGTTLTVTNASNVIYTIDGSSAKTIKNGTSTAFSNIAIGDNVVVQGIVNGTSVSASSIIDQATSTPSSGFHLGFFGSIGNFFKRLFGF